MITINGLAPSTWLLLILDPVTVTFSRVTTPSSDSDDSLSPDESLSVATGVDSTDSSTTVSGSSSCATSPGLSATTAKVTVNNENKNKFFMSLIIKISP